MHHEDGRDRRLIQTAVLGDKDSDDPALLPTEAVDLECFRADHAEHTFWCGLLLGGCGGQLYTKRYTDRVCHFAHHIDPEARSSPCRRTATGVASADHLYVRRALAGWASAQNVASTTVLVDDGLGPGAGVQLDVPDRDLIVRVQLRAISPQDWFTQQQALREQAKRVQWWFATGLALTHLPLTGPVHRVRCDTDGTTRRISLRADQAPDDAGWSNLDALCLSRRGISLTSPPAPAEAGGRQSVGHQALSVQRFLQELADAQAAFDLARVKDLISAGTRLRAQVTKPGERDQLKEALIDGRLWLRSHDPVESRNALFAELLSASTYGTAAQLRDRIARATALLATDPAGPTGQEQRALDHAATTLAALIAQEEAQANAQRAAAAAHAAIEELLVYLDRGAGHIAAGSLARYLGTIDKHLRANPPLTADQRTAINRWRAHYQSLIAVPQAGTPTEQQTAPRPSIASSVPRATPQPTRPERQVLPASDVERLAHLLRAELQQLARDHHLAQARAPP